MVKNCKSRYYCEFLEEIVGLFNKFWLVIKKLYFIKFIKELGVVFFVNEVVEIDKEVIVNLFCKFFIDVV